MERGENHIKSGYVECFSYADGEIVGLRLDFLIVFSLQPLTEQLPNKRSNS